MVEVIVCLSPMHPLRWHTVLICCVTNGVCLDCLFKLISAIHYFLFLKLINILWDLTFLPLLIILWTCGFLSVLYNSLPWLFVLILKSPSKLFFMSLCDLTISWVHICLACVLSCFGYVWHVVTPWTAAPQAPPSMGFSRQEYWSGIRHPHNYLLLILFSLPQLSKQSFLQRVLLPSGEKWYLVKSWALDILMTRVSFVLDCLCEHCTHKCLYTFKFICISICICWELFTPYSQFQSVTTGHICNSIF